MTARGHPGPLFLADGSEVRPPGTYQAEIRRVTWRFTRNNGITEGFHNKMELVSRQAYGFRNFENYRLRARVLCFWQLLGLGLAPLLA